MSRPPMWVRLQVITRPGRGGFCLCVPMFALSPLVLICAVLVGPFVLIAAARRRKTAVVFKCVGLLTALFMASGGLSVDFGKKDKRVLIRIT